MRIELENRLIDFSVEVNKLLVSMPKSLLVQALGLQLLRSATSAALNYGEAQSAESRKDFIHKISIVLKELRESEINLKIFYRSKIVSDEIPISKCINECRQLIAIFQKSLNTIRNNNRNK
jgi:four helix bundle protein